MGSGGDVVLRFRDCHSSVGGRVVVLALLLDLASDGNLGVPVQVSASFCVSRLSKDSR